MRPVEMRHDCDCTASVLAALFELPIEEMPDFWKAPDSPKMFARISRWLTGGIDCPLLRDFVKEKSASPTNTFPPRGYWVAQISSVDRLRDGDPNHVILMQGRRPVFNPGGSVKQALAGPWFLIGYYLLVPLDPAVKA